MRDNEVSRRDVVRGLAGAATAAGVGVTATGTATASAPDFDGWFRNVNNYNGVVDLRGNDPIRIGVGATANNGTYGYQPAAVRIDPGTTVRWEWTGRGGEHDVVGENREFESDLVAEAGHTFERTFDEPGIVKYFCSQHRDRGMKGALVVDDGQSGGGPDLSRWDKFLAVGAGIGAIIAIPLLVSRRLKKQS